MINRIGSTHYVRSREGLDADESAHPLTQPEGAAEAPPPAPSAVETGWTAGYRRRLRDQNTYNKELAAAARRWPELDPLVLKSMLAQESNFEPSARNVYGYAGIAQLGTREARSQGLYTGTSRMRNSKQGITARVDRRDERLIPGKAIPAAAGLMRDKAAVLERGARVRGEPCAGFSTLGRPEGDDYWRFVAASYNGGEGTILLAMHYAYGDTPPDAVRWDDLVAGPGEDVRRSPLYRAIRAVGMNPDTKYREISEYARDVLLRARQ
jgi:hypothetical protein